MIIYNLSKATITIPFGKSMLNLPAASMVTLQVDQNFVKKTLPAMIEVNKDIVFYSHESENLLLSSMLLKHRIEVKDADKKLKELKKSLNNLKVDNSSSKPRNDLNAGLPASEPVDVGKEIPMPFITIIKKPKK